MLAQMRSTVSGFFAKALLLFLVLTFAVWGIGDTLRSGGSGQLASVGDEKISAQEFVREKARFERQMQAMGMQGVDTAQLSDAILRRMIQQRLVKLQLKDLGLEANDKLLAARLRHSPSLQAADGSFDREAFSMMLYQQQLSEQAFLEQLRNEIKADALLSSLSVSDLALPESYIELAAKSAGEVRDVVVITLPAATTEIEPADEKALKAFYDGHKELYLQPEKRTLEYVTFPASEINSLVERAITDDMVKERFASDQDRFAVPEERKVSQLLITDEDEAANAEANLKPGVKLEALGKGKRTNLGSIRQDTLSPEAGEAVFAAARDEVVGPFSTDFGQAFYQVDAIVPAKEAEFAGIEKTLRQELVEEQRDSILHDLSMNIEDALAAGKSMGEAIAEAGIKTSSRRLEGVTAAQYANSKDALLASVTERGFALGEGETSGLETAGSNSYYMVSALAVTQATPRPFAEVKTDVASRVKQQRQGEAVREQAAKVKTALARNPNWRAVVADMKLSTRMVANITRPVPGTAGKSPLPALLAQAVFEHGKGEVAGPLTQANGDAALAVITDIRFRPQTANAQQVKNQAAAALNQEIELQYFNALVKRYPVRINQNMVAQINAQGENE